MRRIVLGVLVMALVAVPLGTAIGSGDQSEISGGTGLTASDCPEATASFESEGLPAPTAYAYSCPSEEQIDEFKQTLEEALAHGWEPGTGGEVDE